MTKKPSTDILTAPDRIQQMVHVVRGQRVMLDFDLARLYGVTTARLNEQVRRNQERFPEDFAYQLTQQEFMSLMSQNAISKPGRGGHRKRPWVFTEHGVAMLSGVLKSPTAVRVNIEIIRTFVRLCRLMATPGELVEQLMRLAETVRLHDGQIKAIAQVLNQLMKEPAEARRPSGKRGQSPFVRSALRAVPANGDSPLFPATPHRVSCARGSSQLVSGVRNRL
jgi:hypothetical protein